MSLLKFASLICFQKSNEGIIKLIIVTGGAGFIGSNIVRGLNARGINDILIVDDLTDGSKCVNLSGLDFKDYIDKDDFIEVIQSGRSIDKVEAMFHQGACSDTTEQDGRFMMKINFEYSKAVFSWATQQSIPFYYASSASVYGDGNIFKEEREYERPLNVYAFSKFLFDVHIRKLLSKVDIPVVGLRYFNVYGPCESHKGSMSSVAAHLHKQLQLGDTVHLFEGSGDYLAGCQERDFIHVDDVVAVNLWLLENPQVSGIYNCGTGKARSFNDMAKIMISHYNRGEIVYIPFPETLKGRYQSYTEADITSLRKIGYGYNFISLEQGIERYARWLDAE